MVQNIQQSGPVIDKSTPQAKDSVDSIVEKIMGGSQKIDKTEFITGIRNICHSATKEDINELIKDLDFHYISLGLTRQDLKQAITAYLKSPAATFKFDSSGFKSAKTIVRICDNTMQGAWHLTKQNFINNIQRIDPQADILHIQNFIMDLKLDFGTDGISRLQLKEAIIKYTESPAFKIQSTSNHLFNEIMFGITFPLSNDMKEKTFAIDFSMAEKIEAATYTMIKEAKSLSVKDLIDAVWPAVNKAKQNVTALTKFDSDPNKIAIEFIKNIQMFSLLSVVQDDGFTNIPKENLKREIANFVFACECSNDQFNFKNKATIKAQFMPIIDNLAEQGKQLNYL
ncbi:hypothetical protein ACFL57_04995 [Candidatus Margulisiibacteriota bacterium]